MADIFFSYKSDERERVAPIVARLEAEGWSVFWDRKTPVGATWSAFIRENLEQAKGVLVVWSHASVESHWVEIEAGKGRDLGCFVPLKLDEVEPPFGFEHIQAADFTRWPGDPSTIEWQGLTEAVERCVPRNTTGAHKLARLGNSHRDVGLSQHSLQDTDVALKASRIALSPLLVKFLKQYSRWAFSPLRIKKWGCERAGYERFDLYTTAEIRTELEKLLNDGVLEEKVSKKGNKIYKVKL